MVDASIGGKVGVDMKGLKNQIGLFSNPQVVFVIPEFLDTLPKRQLLAGFAEVIKHSVIYEKNYWDEISGLTFDEIKDWKELIDWSVEVKNYFVTEDPRDTGFRKVLNFGHTIGHALETFSFQNDQDILLHGEAIAIGVNDNIYVAGRSAGSGLLSKYLPTSANDWNRSFGIGYLQRATEVVAAISLLRQTAFAKVGR